MRWLFRLVLCLAALAGAQAPACAQSEPTKPALIAAHGATRFVTPAPQDNVLAPPTRYGPFLITGDDTVALVGATDERSPEQFAAMLRDHPALRALEFREGPGTYDDGANLRLGRMIREAGLATRVEKGGSVRSGAVELFLAGVRREMADEAEFAVHAWLDREGHEATDYPIDAPQNRKYIAYYRDMGMSAEDAAAFYAMTNSVPHGDALWMTGAQMRRWIAASGTEELPRLTYLDLGLALY